MEEKGGSQEVISRDSKAEDGNGGGVIQETFYCGAHDGSALETEREKSSQSTGEMKKSILWIVFLSAFIGAISGVAATIGTMHFEGGAYFSDVPLGSPHGEDIGWLYEYRVADGYGDGTYRPNLPVSRAQAASLLTRQSAEDLMASWVIIDMTYYNGYYFGYQAWDDGRLSYEQYMSNLDRYRWLWEMIESHGAVDTLHIAEKE